MKKSISVFAKFAIGFLVGMIIFRFISCTPESKTVETKMHESVLKSEYVFELENAPTPECHASTVAESKDGLVAAWFAGTKEKNKDVGIWVSRLVGTNWTAPVEIVNGVQDDGTRYPCWNPVLFQPEDQPLMLFYKVGPSPREWWGMLVISDDGGNTWSEPQKLPGGILGPIKNKPVQLANDDLLCPTSTEHDGWKVQIERTTDLGQTWTTTGDINDGKKIGAIQPSLLFHAEGQLQMLCRTENEFISESWSDDNGETWGPMTLIELPNPNSGIDAVTLKDGRHVLIYNPTNGDWGARVPLSVAISSDGKKWTRVFDLEPVTNPDTVDDEEYSYPSVIQTADGLVHVVYTWNRKSVRHVVLDPAKLDADE